MRRFYFILPIAGCLLALTFAGSAASSFVRIGSGSHVRPRAIFCENVLVVTPDNQVTVGVGDVLTAGSDGFSCVGTITGYIWKRDGTAISGATNSTYPVQSADTGHVITVRVTGTLQSQDSINSVTPAGTSILSDEFNAANGTDPNTDGGGTLWTVDTQSAYSGNELNWRDDRSNIEEDGNGELMIQATCLNSGVTCTDNGHGSGDTWYAGDLTTQDSYSGSRIEEARMKFPCYSDIGFGAGAGDQSGGGVAKDLETGFGEFHTGSSIENELRIGGGHWFNQNSNDRQWAEAFAKPLGSTALCGQWHVFTLHLYAHSLYQEMDGTEIVAAGGGQWDDPGSAHDGYFWDGCVGSFTTLAADANSGATNIKVADVSGFTSGESITVNTNGTADTKTISSVGTSGAGGTGITLTSGLSASHSTGLSTTLAASASAGATNIKVASVTDFYAGQTLSIDTGATYETKVVSSVGTAGSGGTGITLTAALDRAHSSGVAVTANTVSGASLHEDGTSCSSSYPTTGGVTFSSSAYGSNNLGYSSSVDLTTKPVFFSIFVDNPSGDLPMGGDGPIPYYVDWVHIYNN